MQRQFHGVSTILTCPSISVVKCMHTHGHICAHTCTHTSSQEAALPSQRTQLSRPLTTNSIKVSASTPISLLLSGLQGRDSPFLHPELSSLLLPPSNGLTPLLSDWLFPIIISFYVGPSHLKQYFTFTQNQKSQFSHF